MDQAPEDELLAWRARSMVAMALVLARQAEYDSQWEAIRSIAAKVNVSTETLCKWVRRRRLMRARRPAPRARIRPS